MPLHTHMSAWYSVRWIFSHVQIVIANYTEYIYLFVAISHMESIICRIRHLAIILLGFAWEYSHLWWTKMKITIAYYVVQTIHKNSLQYSANVIVLVQVYMFAKRSQRLYYYIINIVYSAECLYVSDRPLKCANSIITRNR